MLMEEEIIKGPEVPCYFLCPISMQLMEDPVTVSTGITYDRRGIEKWLCSGKYITCPVTNQRLSGMDELTPNHNLRRLIQAWCTLNSIERFPTPKPAADRSEILNLLGETRNSSDSEMIGCLQRIRSTAGRNESSRRQIQAAGVVKFLLRIVRTNGNSIVKSEALEILQEFEISDTHLKEILSENDSILDSLIQILQTENAQIRTQGLHLLKSIYDVADPTHLIGSKPEIFVQIIQILFDKISLTATKPALKLLIELSPWGRNRIKAVQADAVSALIEILLETIDRRTSELALTALDQLCGCAEGRAQLLGHGAGLAVVSKKILRVSHAASDRAVRILASIAKYSANRRVFQEMAEVGVVTKLCLLVQIEGSGKRKEKAKEILRLHSRVWKGAAPPCVPPHLVSTYPSG